MDRLASLLESFNPRAITVAPYCFETQGATDFLARESVAQLCLLQRGSADWRQSENDKISLVAGDLLWVTNGDNRGWTSTQKDTVLVVCTLQFGSDNQNPLLHRLPNYVPILGDTHDAAHTLAPVISLMLQETTQPECGQSQVQQRLAEVLLIRVLRFLMRNSVLQLGVIGALGDARLARAMTAMHDQPGNSWTVDHLARHAGMSRTAFSNSFKEIVGKSPMQYLTDWRMGLASKWLADQKQTVGEVGERLGYRSETAFRRAFKNTVGVPPGSVRK